MAAPITSIRQTPLPPAAESRSPVASRASPLVVATSVAGQPPVQGQVTSFAVAPQVEPRAVEVAMQQLNEALKPHDLRAEVTMSETLNRLVLTFYDERTDEMVYQFPPRNVLEVVASILQQAGILVDRQA